MKKIELLAPAKNAECGIAAINFGADAVYIGPPKFGARFSAANSIKDIESLIKYAHKYNSCVYATVNTILTDKELINAEQLIHELYNIGIDAVIIQDMGITELKLPPIPIFASTQTNNYSPDKIKFLQDSGFSRIILARELALEQIKDIRSKTNVDLETFVFGALCVSFSGRCYLSQSICGRSANKGECSQPCRLPYIIKDENNQIIGNEAHYLSLKDLNLSEYLLELMNAGISSFKIEGRLKDINYVKNTTAYFRKKLDFIFEHSDTYSRSSAGQNYFDFEPDLEKTFNRGATDYFFNGRQQAIANFKTPKSMGKKVATALYTKGRIIQIKSLEKLSNGDGLCYFDAKNILKGFFINKIADNSIVASAEIDIPKNASLFRNQDIIFENTLKNSKSARKISININFDCTEKKIHLEALDENNNTAAINLECGLSTAENPELQKQQITKALSKTGNTIFEVKEVRILSNTIYFIPKSLLNQLRRELLEKLENTILSSYQRKISDYIPKIVDYPKNDINDIWTLNVANTKAAEFYKQRGISHIEPALEQSLNYKNKALMTTKYCLRYELGICHRLKSQKSNSENISTSKIKAAKSLFLCHGNNKYKLEFNCKTCEMSIRQEE